MFQDKKNKIPKLIKKISNIRHLEIFYQDETFYDAEEYISDKNDMGGYGEVCLTNLSTIYVNEKGIITKDIGDKMFKLHKNKWVFEQYYNTLKFIGILNFEKIEWRNGKPPLWFRTFFSLGIGGEGRVGREGINEKDRQTENVKCECTTCNLLYNSYTTDNDKNHLNYLDHNDLPTLKNIKQDFKVFLNLIFWVTLYSICNLFYYSIICETIFSFIILINLIYFLHNTP